MRLPRPRLTVRRLMVLVACLGALLGAGIEARRLYRLHVNYDERAEMIALWMIPQYENGAELSREEWREECRLAQEMNGKSPVAGGQRLVFYSPPPPEVCRILLAYHRGLEAKYRRAARYPWLPVEPDPPMPRPTWAEPE